MLSADRSIYDKEFALKHKKLIFNDRFEGFKILKKICDAFDRDIRGNGAEPVFVILPEKGDYRKYFITGITRYQPLTKYLRMKNYNYVDILNYFVAAKNKYDLDDLYYGNHYTPKGNAIVAIALKDYLKRRGSI